MKKLTLLLFAFVLFACDDDANTCGAYDADNLPEWLAPHIEDIEDSSMSNMFYVSTNIYKGQQVFMIRNCCPNCGTVVPVYDCEGQKLGNVGGEFNTDILNGDEIVWKSTDFICERE